MIPVLIVDDEKWICELIRQSVAWSDLGMIVAGLAYNGNEAMNLIEKHKAEVVITDIRMPGIDGISLIRQIREKGINTRFIIISGYQDFEYAQNAIKYNVTDYLLKPIDEDELTLTLFKIAENIRSNQQKIERQNALETKLEETSSKLKEQFIRMFVKDGTVDSTIKSMDSMIELEFKEKLFRCVIFRIDRMTGGVCEKDVEYIILKKILETVDKMMSPFCSYYSFGDDNTTVFVFNFDRDAEIKKHLKDCFIDLKLTVNTYRDYVLTMGVGNTVNTFEKIHHSYANADIAVKYRLVAGQNRMIESELLKLDNSAAKDFLTPALRRKLINLIQTGDKENLCVWIDNVFRFEERKKINPVVLFDVERSIFACFRETLAETGYILDSTELQPILSEIESSNSLDMFVGRIKGNLIDEIEKWEEKKREECSRPIAAVKEYIGKNFERDITLADAAARVFLNPNYLSSLFKKETSMTFLEYLQKYRMEVAQDLLKDASVRPALIPEMVGYKDSKHFAKLFKKIVGLSPAEYRKLYS